MNEDSVALIMCEKCVYRIRVLEKGSGTIGSYLFKRYFLLIYDTGTSTMQVFPLCFIIVIIIFVLISFLATVDFTYT